MPPNTICMYKEPNAQECCKQAFLSIRTRTKRNSGERKNMSTSSTFPVRLVQPNNACEKTPPLSHVPEKFAAILNVAPRGSKIEERFSGFSFWVARHVLGDPYVNFVHDSKGQILSK